MFDILSVGHLAVDSIFLPGRTSPFVVLGGSGTYVSLAARRLDARVAVMSKVGADFADAYKWWLEQEGIDLTHVRKDENGLTTRFELKYDEGLSDRVLRSEHRMPPIRIEDISPIPKTRVVHLGPIAGEIGYETAKMLRDFGEITSLDPQGLVRRFDDQGNVTLEPLMDKRILELVDIFKSSLSEIRTVTGISDLDSATKAIHDFGVKIVIVTLGKDGAAVSVEGSIHKVPASKPVQFIDPTGAGDAFIGGFLAEYVRGEDCSWCSCVGAASASFVVEGIGPTVFGRKEEIYLRAHDMYEKEIKQ